MAQENADEEFGCDRGQITAEQPVKAGDYLRKKREEQKIPLESVARVTRITLSNLQALEKDELHLSMSEVFVRGYLRNYAKFLQLNPDEILDLYQRPMDMKNGLKQDEKPPIHPAFSLLKNISNLIFDFLATVMGAAPPFTIGKTALRSKH